MIARYCEQVRQIKDIVTTEDPVHPKIGVVTAFENGSPVRRPTSHRISWT